MALFGSGAEAPSVLMLLGGAPVGERFIEWNFVSSLTGAIGSSESGLARRTHEAAGSGQRGVHPASPRSGAKCAGDVVLVSVVRRSKAEVLERRNGTGEGEHWNNELRCLDHDRSCISSAQTKEPNWVAGMSGRRRINC